MDNITYYLTLTKIYFHAIILSKIFLFLVLEPKHSIELSSIIKKSHQQRTKAKISSEDNSEHSTRIYSFEANYMMNT